MHVFIVIFIIFLIFINIKSFIRLYKSNKFLRKNKEYRNNKNYNDRIKVIIPVYNEVKTVEKSIVYFSKFNYICDVIYVTTSKEKTKDTYNKIEECIKKYNTSNIKVINAPNTHGTMANQLNYASSTLSKNDIIAIYNVDSFPERKTFDYVLNNINEHSVSPEERVKRLKKRNPKDPDLSLDKVMNLQYNTIMQFISNHNDLPFLMIDTDSKSPEEILNIVLDEINSFEKINTNNKGIYRKKLRW